MSLPPPVWAPGMPSASRSPTYAGPGSLILVFGSARYAIPDKGLIVEQACLAVERISQLIEETRANSELAIEAMKMANSLPG